MSEISSSSGPTITCLHPPLKGADTRPACLLLETGGPTTLTYRRCWRRAVHGAAQTGYETDPGLDRRMGAVAADLPDSSIKRHASALDSWLKTRGGLGTRLPDCHYRSRNII